MNELRPEIAPLADAVTDAARADALIRMSDSTLLTCEFTIRNRLMHSGFRLGLDYLDAALALLRSPRKENGALPQDLLLTVTEHWQAMRRLSGARSGDSGGVSLT